MTNTTTTTAFNQSAEFVISIKRAGIAVPVRMPSQEEWAARSRAIKTVSHRVGVSGTETKSEGAEAADFALLATIRTDENGPEVDDATAVVIIDKLTRADVDSDPEREGKGLLIKLTVCGDIVTEHVLRIPTIKEVRAYRRAAFSFVDLRRGRQQIKVNVDAFCEFYDGLLQENRGYAAGEIPAPHKMAVISELISVLDELENEPDPNS